MLASRRVALAALAAGTTTALTAHAFAQADGNLLLRGAGSTFAAPLYARWAAAWHERTPNVAIEYDPVGSGEGISRFVTGSVDFAGTDTLLKDEQIAAAPGGARMIPVTAGAVVLAYHLDGVPELKLPRDVYPAILAGEITRWDDERIAAANPGVEMPSRDIALVTRLDGSGTTSALTTHLNAVSPTWQERFGIANRVDWPASAMLARGNEGVSGRIKQTQDSIGYVEYGFAKRLGLATATLQNRAGDFVVPGERSAGAAIETAAKDMPADFRMTIPDPAGTGAYPIVTFSWIVLPTSFADAAKGRSLVEFVHFALTEGQALGADLGYIPIPSKVVDQAAAALDVGL